jgi:hypothetical protein
MLVPGRVSSVMGMGSLLASMKSILEFGCVLRSSSCFVYFKFD